MACAADLVMALADDLGFSDVSWVNPSVKTPTLDSLEDGVILHRLYVFCYYRLPAGLC